MVDPLTEVVSLLQPLPIYSKLVTGAGKWRILRSEEGQPFYCVVLSGTCHLAAEGHEPLVAQEGDFVLIPSAYNFTVSSLDAVDAHDLETAPTILPHGEYRLGPVDEEPNVRNLVGYCTFGSADADLLVSLLPRLIHIRGENRLSLLVQLVADESRAQRPARDVILARLLEVLLIEALRFTSKEPKFPGLLSGLADDRLAAAIRAIHGDLSQPWTVERLAEEASLSRSAFYERFTRALGVAPMEYLFVLRMALAKRLLRKEEGNVATIAERVGYGSASAFTVAFTRHVGIPPARYAREERSTGVPPVSIPSVPLGLRK